MPNQRIVTRNPLLARVRRHGDIATLFRQGPPSTLPAVVQTMPVDRPAPQSVGVAMPVPNIMMAIAMPTPSPLAATVGSSPIAAAATPDPIFSPGPQMSTAMPLPPKVVGVPTGVPTVAPAPMEDEDPSWRRLQTIMRKHQEKQAQEVAAGKSVPSPPAVPRLPDENRAANQRRTSNVPSPGADRVAAPVASRSGERRRSPGTYPDPVSHHASLALEQQSVQRTSAAERALSAAEAPTMSLHGPEAATIGVQSAYVPATAVASSVTAAVEASPTTPAHLPVSTAVVAAQSDPLVGQKTQAPLDNSPATDPGAPMAAVLQAPVSQLRPSAVAPAVTGHAVPGPLLVQRTEDRSTSQPQRGVGSVDTQIAAAPAMGGNPSSLHTTAETVPAPSAPSMTHSTAFFTEALYAPPAVVSTTDAQQAAVGSPNAADETTELHALPLDTLWPVQRQPEPALAPVSTPSAVVASAALPAGAGSRPVHQGVLEQTLAHVATEQPTDSRVEVVAPRRPRPLPSPLSASARLPEQTAADATFPLFAGASVDSEMSAVQQQPYSSFQGEPQRLSTAIPTDIGPLPSDLWALIGQQPPSSIAQSLPAEPMHPLPVQAALRHAATNPLLSSLPAAATPIATGAVLQRSPTRPTASVLLPGVEEEPANAHVNSVNALSMAPPSAPPLVHEALSTATWPIQRQAAPGDGVPREATADARQPEREAEGGDTEVERGPPVDVDALARQVYVHLKQRLRLEQEWLRYR